jgi:hypothetical protein
VRDKKIRKKKKEKEKERKMKRCFGVEESFLDFFAFFAVGEAFRPFGHINCFHIISLVILVILLKIIGAMLFIKQEIL